MALRLTGTEEQVEASDRIERELFSLRHGGTSRARIAKRRILSDMRTLRPEIFEIHWRDQDQKILSALDSMRTDAKDYPREEVHLTADELDWAIGKIIELLDRIDQLETGRE